MADELPPGTPEVDDPILLADLIRILSIKGALGKMRVADIVLPIVSLGDVVQPTVEVRQAAFRSTDIFGGAGVVAPAVNTILADTGPLPAGVYDVALYASSNDSGSAAARTRVEHRDAANAANLAQWDLQTASQDQTAIWSPWITFGYELALNERLRMLNVLVGQANKVHIATIFARLRA